jgi:phospholipid-binding lipoprotein MlaA
MGVVKKGKGVVEVVSELKGHVAFIAGLIACITFLVTGCATPPPASDSEALAAFNEVNDPYEPFNRSMLEFNLALDKIILRPVAYVYKEGVPTPIKSSVTNILANLRGPVIFANDLLQGEVERAGTTLVRFTMNSTVGLLGIIDVASEVGFEKHAEDFGQTLAIWEVEEGPYLVLPIFGPSNPRDGIGIIADTLMDPLTWLTSLEIQLGIAGGEALDRRARNFDQLNDLENNSLDFYAAVRSLYRQKRRDEILNGAPASMTPVPGSLSGAQSKGLQGQQSNAILSAK